MIQLWTFGLALFGFAMYIFLITAKRDAEDPRPLTPLDFFWRGAAKWKTIANVMFIFAVCVVFPPEFLQQTVGADIGGVPVGKGGAVIFGVISEAAMVKLFRIKEKAVENGEGIA